MATERFMLSTIDNPYSPFTHWDEWKQWDEEKGYYSLPLLARCTITSDELSESDQILAVEYAIDEIIQENVSGVHVKIYRDQVVIPRILPD